MKIKIDSIFTRDQFSQIPKTSGVYILSSADEVVLYVGKSKNLHRRITTHISSLERITMLYSHSFQKFEIIHHTNLETLSNLEAEVIAELKPLINSGGDKKKLRNYLNSDFDKYVCKGNIKSSERCLRGAKYNGYCWFHNPSKRVKPSWLVEGKPITTKLNKMIDEIWNQSSRNRMHIYMNQETLQLLSTEKTHLKFDVDCGEYRFNKHYVHISDTPDIEICKYHTSAV